MFQYTSIVLDCEQSLLCQSRLGSAGLERANSCERGKRECEVSESRGETGEKAGKEAGKEVRLLSAVPLSVNSLSPVLPSLDVTDRRGTARSLVLFMVTRQDTLLKETFIYLKYGKMLEISLSFLWQLRYMQRSPIFFKRRCVFASTKQIRYVLLSNNK